VPSSRGPRPPCLRLPFFGGAFFLGLASSGSETAPLVLVALERPDVREHMVAVAAQRPRRPSPDRAVLHAQIMVDLRDRGLGPKVLLLSNGYRTRRVGWSPGALTSS